MSDEELIDIATKSMLHSDANLMVANCLEWARYRAYIIKDGSDPKSVKRESGSLELSQRLLNEIKIIYNKEM